MLFVCYLLFVLLAVQVPVLLAKNCFIFPVECVGSRERMDVWKMKIYFTQLKLVLCTGSTSISLIYAHVYIIHKQV
jgi:ABC-type cobalamin transport system permease subunit